MTTTKAISLKWWRMNPDLDGFKKIGKEKQRKKYKKKFPSLDQWEVQ